MPVMINRHSARMLSMEDLLPRLDALGCILNGAKPVAIHTIVSGYPEKGRMVGWIDRDKRFYIGHLGDSHRIKEGYDFFTQYVYTADPATFPKDDLSMHFGHSHMIEKGMDSNRENQFIYWIEFDDESRLTYYKEPKNLTCDGIFSAKMHTFRDLNLEFFKDKSLISSDKIIVFLEGGQMHTARLIDNDVLEIDKPDQTHYRIYVGDVKAWMPVPKYIFESLDNIDQHAKR
ncbi:hypothetical protein KFS98_003714 [Salmonella enterica]|nr:hypothetical protein [Salmonella enterica]